MTKAEFIEKVGKGMDEVPKKDLTTIVNSVFSTVRAAIKKEKKFSYPEFGTFTVRKRKARKGRNPQTGEEIKIKASKTVGFKPSPKFKDSL